MPVTTGAACLTSETCPVVAMPTRSVLCGLDFLYGGINDIYVIPCTETLSQVNITSTAWWTTLTGAGHLGNLGLGLGSIAKKSDKKEKVGSCRGEQIISTTWALKYVIKSFDKTSADITTEQVNALLKRYNNFQIVARMCDGADTVLPIGTFSVSDFNWIVPESNEDLQTVEFEISWIEFGKPKLYTVAGLSAIVPKA
jgi:hypothetical protein